MYDYTSEIDPIVNVFKIIFSLERFSWENQENINYSKLKIIGLLELISLNTFESPDLDLGKSENGHFFADCHIFFF